MVMGMVVIGLLVLIGAGPDRAASSPPRVSGTARDCIVRYTGFGLRPGFHFSLPFRVQTDRQGKVVRVRKSDPNLFRTAEAFVEIDPILRGLRTWKIQPSGSHIVIVNTGTDLPTRYRVEWLDVLGDVALTSFVEIAPNAPCPYDLGVRWIGASDKGR